MKQATSPSNPTNTPGAAGPPGAADQQHRCGTLRYTAGGILTLFFWLLWGDFTFSLMESAPGLLVIQLKDHHVSTFAIGILLGTLGTVCNTVLNPIYSSWSDRFRSRWGRRRPFLMVSAPLITLFLVLIPWAPQISDALMKIGWTRTLLTLFPAAPIVLVFGALIVSFDVVNMVLCTVYYYLLPDTVPEPLIGRFYGYFRVVGIVAGILFSWFIFGHAREYMRFIYAGLGLLYLVSFSLMCWHVKEGEYPVVKEEHRHWYSVVKNYFTECFGSGRNRLIFLVYASTQWAGASGIFIYFFYSSTIGLTDQEYGHLNAIASTVNLAVAAPFGILVDRLGAHKSLVYGLLFSIVFGIVAFLAIHDYVTAFAIGIAGNLPRFLAWSALGKWTVDMYPRALYGQFASAGAITGAAGCALLTPACGKLIDLLGNYYRLALIVPVICHAVCLVGCFLLARWPKDEVEGMEAGLDAAA